MSGADVGARQTARRLAKAMAVDAGDAGRLAEAVIVVVAARVALRLLRVETLARICRRVAHASVPIGADRDGAVAVERRNEADRLAWAADAASNAVGLTCLPRSLGLCWLLARRGLSADLCLGAPRGRPRLPWHAWVELDGLPLGREATAPEDAGETPFEVVCRLPLEPFA